MKSGIDSCRLYCQLIENGATDRPQYKHHRIFSGDTRTIIRINAKYGLASTVHIVCFRIQKRKIGNRTCTPLCSFSPAPMDAFLRNLPGRLFSQVSPAGRFPLPTLLPAPMGEDGHSVEDDERPVAGPKANSPPDHGQAEPR